LHVGIPATMLHGQYSSLAQVSDLVGAGLAPLPLQSFPRTCNKQFYILAGLGRAQQRRPAQTHF